jgi:hypothetical protein
VSPQTIASAWRTRARSLGRMFFSPRYEFVFLVVRGAFLSNLADLSTPGAKRRRYGQRPNPFIGQWETSKTLANPIRHSKLGLLAANACRA